MKTLKRILGSMIFLLLYFTNYGFVAHIYGPEYTCTNSELQYTPYDDYGCNTTTITVTHGEVYNEVTQQWVTNWTYTATYQTIRVRWDNSPLGTVGNVHIHVCDCTVPVICSNGDRNVTFGPSTGTPVISGSIYILNCQSQQESYSAANIPTQWSLANWNLSSHLQQIGGGIDPITLAATSTTYQGSETLTGVFHFTTDGNTCGTKNVDKNIWLGKPSPAGQTVDGYNYSPGYQICPGNHWVGITWNGLVSSTAWTVTPGIYYTSTNTECDFTLPSNGYSSVSISVNGSNACGTSYNASYYVTKKSFGCGSFLIVAYPNPAKEELTIETIVRSDTENLEYSITADEIDLMDNSNTKLIVKFPTQSTATLDTKTIPKGEYFLRVRFGKYEVTRRILIDK